MKLQDAYVSESGVYVGNWQKIGYSMAPTTTFSYAGGDLEAAATTALASLSDKSGWIATNNAKLNDCAANQTWSIKVSEASTGNTSASPVVYEAVYSDETNCSPLTANFNKLTTKN